MTHAVELDDDRIFWDRLQDMPAWEAEQECVSRREWLGLENAMLCRERDKLMARKGVKDKEVHSLGVAMFDNNARMSKLTERIKYLRKLQSKLEWKAAVQTLFGDEAYEQCVVWLEQQYGHIAQARRELDGRA